METRSLAVRHPFKSSMFQVQAISPLPTLNIEPLNLELFRVPCPRPALSVYQTPLDTLPILP